MRMILLLAALVLPLTAQAYIGPGLGAGVLAAIAGVLISIVLAIVALFWYPIKRLLGLGNKRKNNAARASQPAGNSPASADTGPSTDGAADRTASDTSDAATTPPHAPAGQENRTP